MAGSNLTFGESVGAGLIGSAANTLFSGIGGAINNRYAQNAADHQYKLQLDFWNRQNAYNSPAAMKKRLQDAGLNPALMYGAGTTANEAGALSSVPGNEYAKAGVLQNFQPEQMYLQSRLTMAQIDDLEASADQKRADANKTNTLLPFQVEIERWNVSIQESKSVDAAAKAAISQVSQYIAESTKDDVISLKHQELVNAEQEWDRMAAEIRKLNAQALGEEIDNETRREENQARIADLWTGLLLKKAQIELAKANQQLTLEQIQTEITKRGIIPMQIAEIGARISMMNADNARKEKMFEQEWESLKIANDAQRWKSTTGGQVYLELKDICKMILGIVPGSSSGNVGTGSSLITPSHGSEKMPIIYQ